MANAKIRNASTLYYAKRPNPAVNRTLRDKAAQRRLP